MKVCVEEMEQHLIQDISRELVLYRHSLEMYIYFSHLKKKFAYGGVDIFSLVFWGVIYFFEKSEKYIKKMCECLEKISSLQISWLKFSLKKRGKLSENNPPKNIISQK